MPFRSNRACPACGDSFAICRTAGYSYERCQRCLGIWITKSIIDEMLASIVPGSMAQFTKAPPARERRCPDCQVRLEHALLFRIPVDRCEKSEHGIWFDKDELRQVLERVKEPEPAEPEVATSFTSLLGEFFHSTGR